VLVADEPLPESDHDVLDSRRAGGMFLRGSGLRVIAYFGAVLASIGATPLVARHLHKVSYGRYVTVISLLLIVAALTEGGLVGLGVREFSQGGDGERREFMRSLLGLRIALSVAGAIAAILFTLLVGYPRVVVEGTVIASVGLVIINTQVTLSVPLTTNLRLPWLAVLDFVGPAVTSAGLVILALLNAPLAPFFVAAVVAYAVMLVITAALVRHQVTLRPSFAIGRWRSILTQSVVFAAATGLAAIYFQVVVVATSLLSTAAQVGVFGLAFRILSVVNGIPLLLIGSAFPILLRSAHNDRARMRYAVQRLLEGSLLLGGWLSMLVVVGAPFAIQVMGGNGYAGSTEVLHILGAGIAATFLSMVFGFAQLSLRMYRQLIAINAAAVIGAVLLCVTLIPAHGAHGAAIVTLTVEVGLAVTNGVMLLVTHPELRPELGMSARILTALAIAFAVALLAPLSSVLACLAGSAALVAAVAVLRAFPQELLAAWRQRGTASNDAR
jgi:O-antigen/teichoic acid export membrane protein